MLRQGGEEIEFQGELTYGLKVQRLELPRVFWGGPGFPRTFPILSLKILCPGNPLSPGQIETVSWEEWAEEGYKSH